MKRLPKTFKSLILSMSFLLCLNTYIASAAEYYVSPSGNDNNSGTISAPFYTLNKAWTVVKAGDLVYMRGGTYTYTTKQSLTGKNGTASNLITVSAFASESPVITFGGATQGITLTGNYISFKGIEITGLTTITGWTSSGNGIYSKAVVCGSATNMVTLNNVNTPMGRYPKTGWLTIDSHVGISTITDAALPASPNLTGGEIVVRRFNWVTDRCIITNHASNTITYKPYTGGSTSEPRDGSRYFIQNHISTLTQLGDWYYNGNIFYMYFGTNNPSSNTVKVSTVDVPMYVFNCNYITFENMTFQGGNLASFNSTISDYVTLQNCTIKNSGKNGIMTGVWGSTSNYLKVSGCTIDNTNNCAISLERENAYATISNNTITNTGVFSGMGSKDVMPGVFCAINSYLSDYCTVEYNKIINTGYVPIGVGDKASIIRNNLIDTYCFSKDDGGGIYMYGGDATVKREIKNNIILNGIGAGLGSANGIYMDDKTNNVEVSGNTVSNCNHSGIYVHNSQDVNVHDNTVYDAAVFLINLVHDNNSSTSPLRNTIVLNNIVFAKATTQKALQYATLASPSDINLFGIINNNYYCSPLDIDPKFQTFYGGWANAALKNFASWKTYCGQEANSRVSNVKVQDASYLRFEYNASNVNKIINLDGTYVDAKSIQYSGSITLLPYTSAVLIRTSSIIQVPTNQAPSIQNQGFQINNSSSNGTVVGTVVATDPDAGQTLTYSILSGNTNNAFAINASTGVITVANSSALLGSTGETAYSLFQTTTPSSSSINYIGTGTAPLEVGMKFTSNVGGYITGLRFYKGVGGKGAHIGNLWSLNGTNLASATFTNETASGWQTVSLNSPVAITANTTYVVSYFSQNGDFVKTDPFFTSNIVNGPLTGLGWTAAEPNGVYKYSSSSSFPNVSTYAGQSNYWADVEFSTSTTTTNSTSSSSNTTTAPIALVVKVQDNGTGSLSSQATIAITISSNTVNHSPVINNQTFSVSGNSPNGTIVGNVLATDPDSGQTLTYSILSGNTNNAFAINASTGVLTVANSSALLGSTGGTVYSLFQTTMPSSSSINYIGTGTAPLEVGMKFTSNVGGYITGLRFYKGVGGKGTHIGNLWSINGTNLASATFINETASGWQTVTLSSPVAITANTTYVVSYFSQNGDFVKTDPFFTSNILNGPLTGLGWTAAQPNGVYKYSSSPSFPNVSTYAGQSNYWADVVFSSTLTSTAAPTSLVVKVQDNGTGSLSSQATIAITINSNTVNHSPVINNQTFSVSGNSPNGTIVGNVLATDPDAGQTLTYSILSGNTNNAFAINASTGVITVANSSALWGTSYSLFQAITPSSSIINNIGTGTAPLEVGMKFTSSVGGYITGLRFYKGVGGKGTHIGNLWSINGTNLASATFTNETSSGWQTVTLSSPVAITANTTYVVSYFSQNGDFVKTDPFFTTNIVNGPLTGLGWTAAEPNGVYKYSSSSSFPNVSTYSGQSNYWADVVFSSTLTPVSTMLVVKVQDNGSGSLSNQATITINLNPLKSANLLSIISTPQETVTVGSPYLYKVIGLSNNGSLINYTVENLPYWLTFTDKGDGTGYMEGIPSIEDIGSNQIILKGRNSIQEVQQEFKIEVESNFLKDSQKDHGIHIYPNPVTNGILNISIAEGINEKYEILILDMSGKTLIHKESDRANFSSLDLSRYSSGMYMIQLRSPNFNFSDKFILK